MGSSWAMVSAVFGTSGALIRGVRRGGDPVAGFGWGAGSFVDERAGRWVRGSSFGGRLLLFAHEKTVGVKMAVGIGRHPGTIPEWRRWHGNRDLPGHFEPAFTRTKRSPTSYAVKTTEQKATTGGPILMAFSAATTSPAISSAEGSPHRGPSRSTVQTTEQGATKATTGGRPHLQRFGCGGGWSEGTDFRRP